MNKLFFWSAMCLMMGCSQQLQTLTAKKTSRWVNDFHFSYLQTKAKIKWTNQDQSLSGIAQIRMKKDSMIWISVSMGLGIELVRIILHKTGVEAISKLNKTYYNYTFQEIHKKYGVPLNYARIEALLLGNLITPIDTSLTYEEKDNQFILFHEEKGYHIHQFIGKKTKKINHLKIEDKSNFNQIIVNYDEFTTQHHQLFPTEIKSLVKLENQQNQPPTKVTIAYQQINISQEPLKFPFYVSDKYKKY